MNYKQRCVINCGNSIQAMGDLFFFKYYHETKSITHTVTDSILMATQY